MTVEIVSRPTRRRGRDVTATPASRPRAASDDAAAAAPPTLRARLAWLATATALFLTLYGGCLWVTARRASVPTFCFAWERHLPYVPWMIWPYLSIDLFFLGAFFVCRRHDELTALGRRLTLATLLAAACFLCFPLRYALPVPPTTGFVGDVIGRFRVFDRPFNLAPSLHIAFASILWVVYVRHASGTLRGAVKLWFLLIGVSTLLVRQHHAIDVVGGLFLAMLCLHLVPEVRPEVARGRPRADLARRYAAGALAFASAAFALGAWAYLLLWPAGSLALIAAAYATGDSDVFRKRGGRIPRSTWVVHAPYLLGHRIAWWAQQRGRPPTTKITRALSIGRLLTRAEQEALAPATVIDLTAECDAAPLPAGSNYVPLPMLDLTPPAPETLARAVRAARSAAAKEGGRVYIHCALGCGRAALVAAAYLLAEEPGMSVDDAIARVRSARRGTAFPPGSVQLLRRFARAHASSERTASSGSR